MVNEQTLYPVLLSLAPAAALMGRFPGALRQILGAHGVAEEFIDARPEALGVRQRMKNYNNR